VDTLILVLTLSSSVLIGIFGLVLQHQQNKHFERQNQIMTYQEGGPPMPKSKPPRWPLGGMIAMMVMVWIVGIFDYADRHYPVSYKVQQAKWVEAANTLPTTSGVDLSDKVVNLDGRRFENCTFGDGTILTYEGEKPFIFNCKMVTKPGAPPNHVQVMSDNPALMQMLALNQMFEIVIGAQVPTCSAPEGIPGLPLQ
jgi:hypothetical protein